jgi:hypothetical protein
MYGRIPWELVRNFLGNEEHTLENTGLCIKFFPLCSEDLLSTTECI